MIGKFPNSLYFFEPFPNFVMNFVMNPVTNFDMNHVMNLVMNYFMIRIC